MNLTGSIKKKVLPIMVIMVVGLALLGSGCTGVTSDQGNKERGSGSVQVGTTSEGPIVVAVSIPPQAEFVEKVGGDRVKAVVILPPGGDPHTYEPTPKVLRDVSEARMYAVVGADLPFEKVFLGKIGAVNKDMLLVNCSKGLELRELAAHHDEDHAEEEGSLDPHVWTSPVNAKIMVENIYEGLVKIDPANETYYSQNRDAYIKDLDALDAGIKAKIEKHSEKNFMVFHPSWGYFAAEYGLNMIPVEIEGKEPSAKDLTQLVAYAKEKHVKVIFVQSQFSTRISETLAKEIGGEVVAVDPLARNYLENMDNVSEVFARNLV